ncbi:MAG: hypothetical protein R3250_12795, partial [Melioribacteraceae bacterium]|nr:hypothetical protein [Melioribacteraceae bacterium]
ISNEHYGADGSKAADEYKSGRYFQLIRDWSNKEKVSCFYFEAFDEPWKGNPDNPLGAEKHWGIFTVDRKPKLVMQELYPELN